MAARIIVTARTIAKIGAYGLMQNIIANVNAHRNKSPYISKGTAAAQTKLTAATDRKIAASALSDFFCTSTCAEGKDCRAAPQTPKNRRLKYRRMLPPHKLIRKSRTLGVEMF